MSKNAAWSVYNETISKIEEDFSNYMRPLRQKFQTSLQDIERDMTPKIQALQLERDSRIEKARKEFEDNAIEVQIDKRKSTQQAIEVRNAELNAQKEAKVAEAISNI